MKKSELIQIIIEEIEKVLEQTGNPYGDDLMYQYQQHQKNQALKNRTAIGKGGAKIPFSSLSKGERIAYDILTDPKPSMMYDNPIIGGNVQPELRLAHNSFPTNKLTEPVKIKFIADKAGVLKAADSLELKKDMPYPKGSAIMDNGKGKLWAIPPEDFKKTYTIDPGGKSATPIPVKRRAVQMSKPFKVKPSWSDVPLHGKAGDFLVQYGPGDYGAVDAGEFKKTYNTKAMPKSMTGPTRAKAAQMDKANQKTASKAKIKKATTGGKFKAPAKNYGQFLSRMKSVGRAFPYLNKVFIAYGIREAAKRGFAQGGAAGAAAAIGAETLFLIPIVGEMLMAWEGQKIKSAQQAQEIIDAIENPRGETPERANASTVMRQSIGRRF